MSSKRSQNRRSDSPGRPGHERRKPAGRVGSVRWVQGVLARPLTLQRRADGGLHLALQERRRTPEQIEQQALEQLRAELQTRLLAHELQHAARVMRQLVAVHDAMGRGGWAAVGAMSSNALARAALQARMLASDDGSPPLLELAERLLLLKAAAEVREENARSHRGGDDGDDGRSSVPDSSVEVSLASAEEFEATERGWVATVPQSLTVELPQN